MPGPRRDPVPAVRARRFRWPSAGPAPHWPSGPTGNLRGRSGSQVRQREQVTPRGDSVAEQPGDRGRLKVDGVQPSDGQRDLLQLVSAASWLAELRPGVRGEVPGRDPAEVEVLAFVPCPGIQYLQQAGDIRLAGDLLADLPAERGLDVLVLGVDVP